MAQSFLELKSIARNALPRLIENLVMPNLCYKDYSDTYSDLGNEIQVKIPVKLEAHDFVDGQTVQPQDIEEKSVTIKLDKIATVDINLSAAEMANNMTEEKFVKDFIEPAVIALAEKINAAGLATWKKIPAYQGTIGTTPDGLDDFAKARKFLNKAKAPLSGRVAVWDVEADAAYTQIGNLVKVNESGSPQALREGEIGKVYGLENYMAQGIEAHEKVGAGTVLVDGAATAGSKELHIDGVTTALAVGDAFTIAGDTTIYQVTKAGELAGGDQDIEIIPALAKNAADNAAITLNANPVTDNLVFHKNAIAFVTRPLVAPHGVESYTTSFNGFTLRIVRDYDINTKKEKASMDVLYAYEVVYPELACRYLG